MLSLLAFRNLFHRPWRSALLFLGYGMGVTVMIVLLSIGEALIAQARDEKLVGGGDVTVLPEGLDVEVMKTGGLGGLFFSIANARFVYLQLLASPRLAPDVRAVAPQIGGKLVYLRTPNGREIPVRASGEIPSATRAVGAEPALAAGAWTDDGGDQRWARPTDFELRHSIDHFHLPPAGLSRPESWGEWHYFNVLSPDRQRWVFISFILSGDVGRGQWGAQALVTTHEQGGRSRRYSALVPSSAIRFSTTDADLVVGEAGSVRVLSDGRYAVRAHVRDEATGAPLDVDLVVAPAPHAYFPGASMASGDFVSGYAVAGLRADASGTICSGGGAARRCERYDGAQSYHDHNWGVWHRVSWEWGGTRAGAYTILYGRVYPPDSAGSSPMPPAPLSVYVVDSLGFRALFRPRTIDYEDGLTIRVGGRAVRVPSRAVLIDARGADTLRLEVTVEDAVGTDTREGLIGRGESPDARTLTHPYFIQMKGTARLSGRVDGRPIAGEGAGFFETYR
ncbi:MAG TPA: hypothetical protein VFJ74_06655 [Gemmatimonadaceae bacterium]|nr:hypothetical protein [Gemmatimonadaceae bacterium]